MTMTKAKGNAIGILFGVVLLVWILISTAEVLVANASEEPYIYCRANIWVLATSETTDMVVYDCQPVDDCYEVVLEDIKGNLLAYYDSKAQPIGSYLRVITSGDMIISVKQN